MSQQSLYRGRELANPTKEVSAKKSSCMATTSNVHFDDMSLEYDVNIVIGGHIANDNVKNK